MIQAVTSTKKYSVSFDIKTDDERGLLWIEVKGYEPESRGSWTKDFSGEDYGKALAYFNRICAELKETYGK